MKKSIKIALITALIFCTVGGVLTGIGLANGGLKENPGKYHTYTEDKIPLDDSITALDANLKYLDLLIQPSDDQHYYLSYRVHSTHNGNPFSFAINNETLQLKENDSTPHNNRPAVVDLFSFILEADSASQSSNTITLYVPSDALKEMNFQMNYGDLSLSDCHADNVQAHLGYGDFSAKNSQWPNTSIELGYGDFYGTGLGFSGPTQLCAKYGDINLIDTTIPDFLSIEATSDFGDITANPHFGGTITHSDLDKTRYKRFSDKEQSQLTIKSKYGDIILQ